MIRLLACGIVALVLGGCMLPSTAISRFEAIEPLIEAQVDAVLAFHNRRFCALPVDVLVRQREEHGDDWFKGWLLMCPNAAELFQQ